MYFKSAAMKVFIIVLVSSVLFGCNQSTENKVGQEFKSQPSPEVSNKSVPSNGTTNHKENKENINNIESGLLLGLSTDKEEGEKYNGMFERKSDELRTIWIYSAGNRIVKRENKDTVISPVGDNFFEIRNELFESKEKLNENTGSDDSEIFASFNFYYKYLNMVSNALGSPQTSLYTKTSFEEKFKIEEEDAWTFRSYIEWPWYIGNQYACIMSSYVETGGGSYSSGSDSYKLIKINDLSNIQKREQTEKLFDLLDDNSRKELVLFQKDYNAKLQNEEENYTKKMDLDNLSLTRKNGKWILLIPVFNEYYHPGNGSYYYTIYDYIPYECQLPNEITSYDNLCIEWESIKEKINDATDAMSSPNGDLLVVFTSKEILVFANPKANLEEPGFRIPINKHERVVLNQWATGRYVGKWNDKLKKFLN